MNYGEDIDKAISAHGLWKRRLLSAITSGTSDFTVDQVMVDNRCEFGKWFYSLPNTVRESPQGKMVQKLHTEFHAEAARILGLALKGQKDEASHAIEIGSRYANISGNLTIALTQWKQTIGA